MAWNAPITWVPLQVVGASDMNAQLRDNLNYLFSARPKFRVTRTAGNYSTSVTSWGDIDSTNLTITLTISSGAAWILMTSAVNTGSGQSIYFDYTIDGTRQGQTNGLTGAIASQQITLSLPYIATGLSAGGHMFRPQWKAGAGTSTLSADTNIPLIFQVIEVG
jgi:hypothetical protein